MNKKFNGDRFNPPSLPHDTSNKIIDRKLKVALFGLLIFMMVLITSANVLAIGITPGKTTFEYEPGVSKEVKFTVINSDHVDAEFVVLIQGPLNESISVSEVSFKMGADEESKELSYKFYMPPGLEPGSHLSEVVAIQLPGKSSTSEAFIGAAVGVATQISVFVPFPGKYAEAGFDVIGPEADGKITFVIPVVSRGDLDLAKVRGTIDIFGPLNERIDTISTNEVEILSKQRKEIVAVWDASDILSGPYRAVATVLYDEQVLTIEKEFNVGQRLLSLGGIEVNDFSLGEIAKFEILVENKWSSPIVGAFAQMLVYNNDGDVMADFTSAVYDIAPLEKALIIAFWDTAGVRTGTYDSSLFLRYGDSSEQQDLKLEVKDNEINVIGVGYVISKEDGGIGGSNTLTIVLITVIVVLVLINLLWFLVLRKKLSKRKGK